PGYTPKRRRRSGPIPSSAVALRSSTPPSEPLLSDMDIHSRDRLPREPLHPEAVEESGNESSTASIRSQLEEILSPGNGRVRRPSEGEHDELRSVRRPGQATGTVAPLRLRPDRPEVDETPVDEAVWRYRSDVATCHIRDRLTVG